MIFEETDEAMGGLQLHRYTWRPEGRPRGGVALLHGLGDYTLRYEHVARFFVERGFACEGVDFPGHGKSSGPRGHIPDWNLLSRLIEQILGRMRSVTGGTEAVPGLFAHSMGAYVALEFLSRNPGRVRFAWLSSPLIQPSFNKPNWLLKLADPLGRWFPWFPYDTRVRSADCVTDEQETRAKDPYLHHRTTFGFGRQLISRERSIREGASRMSGDLDLLVTHGTEDLVCPYRISRELFEEIPLARKRFVSL
jgi:alpha-beta hydrolase superfamily lysophospholipase